MKTLLAEKEGSDDSKIRLRLKEPDCFYGKHNENVDRWLFIVEQYFRATKESEDQRKVAYAGSLLRGNAIAWWEMLVLASEASGIPESACTWAEFKQMITQQFRAVNRSRHA